MSARRRIFVSKPYGRLGNLLYKASHLIAFAIEHDLTVWDRSFNTRRYAKLFPKIRNRLFLSYPHSIILPFPCSWFHGVQSALIKILSRKESYDIEAPRKPRQTQQLDIESLFSEGNRSITINEFHYRSYATVHKHGDFIRDLFTPHKKVTAAAHREVNRLKDTHSLVVGVHIRRGDYEQWKGGIHFHSLDAFRSVMEDSIKALSEENIMFVIFSDDIDLDLSPFKGLNHIRLSEWSCISFDWYAMSLCDYIIAPCSTYSGWAAFHGKTPIFTMNGSSCPQSPEDFRPNEVVDWNQNLTSPATSALDSPDTP